MKAKAYAAYDVDRSCWLARKNSRDKRPVGSLMKLLTAKVVLDEGDLDRASVIDGVRSEPGESLIGLPDGERLSRRTLLSAALVVSANDAARALADDVAGSEKRFVTRMNDTARELGLEQTTAGNASGLDAPGAGSTAEDLVTLAAELMRDPTFRDTVGRTSVMLHGTRFPTTNDLLTQEPDVTGIKTGTTSGAGPGVVASAERGGRSVIVAVLGATSDAGRFTQARRLLDWSLEEGTECLSDR